MGRSAWLKVGRWWWGLGFPIRFRLWIPFFLLPLLGVNLTYFLPLWRSVPRFAKTQSFIYRVRKKGRSHHQRGCLRLTIWQKTYESSLLCFDLDHAYGIGICIIQRLVRIHDDHGVRAWWLARGRWKNTWRSLNKGKGILPCPFCVVWGEWESRPKCSLLARRNDGITQLWPSLALPIISAWITMYKSKVVVLGTFHQSCCRNEKGIKKIWFGSFTLPKSTVWGQLEFRWYKIQKVLQHGRVSNWSRVSWRRRVIPTFRYPTATFQSVASFSLPKWSWSSQFAIYTLNFSY